MTSLIPYIVFPGNCREAMQFYVESLHGEISSIQTYGESPIDVPKEMEYRIFDTTLKAGNISIKASDNLPNYPVQEGTNISLFVSFGDRELKEEVFANLSEGGKVMFPLDDNFGMLKDKYGIQWMFVNS